MYVRDTMLAIGASRQSVDKMFTEPHIESDSIAAGKTGAISKLGSQKSLAHAAEDFYRHQLLPGTGELNNLWSKAEDGIIKALAEDKVCQAALLRTDNDIQEVSLFAWAREVLMSTITTAVFGTRLLEIRPDLMVHFTKFDNESWKMNYKVPPSMCPELCKARAQVISGLKQYFQLPREERTDAIWFVRTLETEIRKLDLPDNDIAALYVMPLWVYV